ncbi:MAG: MMPL family transporter [Gordonia sp. (in: high G+C Gram-positive bacteria)]
MLDRLARIVIAMPRRVAAAAVLLLIACGLYGASASQYLLTGGYSDPHSESVRAAELLDDTFHRGGLEVVLKLDAAKGVDMSSDSRAIAVGRGLVAELGDLAYVQKPILSVWQNPTLGSALLSKDRTSALIVVTLDGGEENATAHAKTIEERFAGTRDGISVRIGGQAMIYEQTNRQTTRDLAIAEAIAIPISFLVLIVVFGGLVAAALPIGVGIVSIIATFALLRLIASVTDVSVFALNLTTAMGLALAVDYTLLLVTRYREEVAAGRDRPDAIIATLTTAGRTIAFSAVTVALALAALAVFPMYFLRSFAYAGLGVIAVASLASLIVTPALLMILGKRIDSLSVRGLLRRAPAPARPIEESWWHRVASAVLRHAVSVGAAVIIILLVLGAPFLSIKLGFPDDRVLPSSASARQIQQEIRDDFTQNLSSTVTIVATGDVASDVRATYTRHLSQVAGVNLATSESGTFVGGRLVASGSSDSRSGDIGVITISTNNEPMSVDAQTQLSALRDVAVPSGLTVQFTGAAANNVDTVDAIYSHLPWVFALIAVATFLLLFLFTGSIVLPLKALVLNVLSLSATFGAMVWFFQDGHLGGLGTSATGYLVSTMPVLMFCIAFGLSMDYEVFLLGRIREEWLASDRSRAANDRSVAAGLAKTGRVITAAALLMSIVFAAMGASQVSFMRMFGVGLTLAVLMDATLIRMLLVPAFMRLAGRANWWAPAPLRWLHQRIGLAEGVAEPASLAPPSLATPGEHPPGRPSHDHPAQDAPVQDAIDVSDQENGEQHDAAQPLSPRIR